MLLKFKGYGGRIVYINPVYVMSVSTEPSRVDSNKIYTLITLNGKGADFIIEEPIEEVAKQIEEGMNQ